MLANEKASDNVGYRDCHAVKKGRSQQICSRYTNAHALTLGFPFIHIKGLLNLAVKDIRI